MEWAIWILAVVILGLAAVASTGRLGEMPSTVTDTPQPHVPAGMLSGDDLRGLRFAVVARGYSMQQVDELIDRIAGQLDDDSAGVVPAETRPLID
jgi:DivIVA domain-containing protein